MEVQVSSITKSLLNIEGGFIYYCLFVTRMKDLFRHQIANASASHALTDHNCAQQALNVLTKLNGATALLTVPMMSMIVSVRTFIIILFYCNEDIYRIGETQVNS